MGEHLDRLMSLTKGQSDLVPLSVLSRVKSYKRTSSTGKVVDVEAYTRTLKSMSSADLVTELRQEKGNGNRAKEAQIVNEIRRRKVAPVATDTKAAKSPEVKPSFEDRAKAVAAEHAHKTNSDLIKEANSLAPKLKGSGPEWNKVRGIVYQVNARKQAGKWSAEDEKAFAPTRKAWDRLFDDFQKKHLDD